MASYFLVLFNIAYLSQMICVSLQDMKTLFRRSPIPSTQARQKGRLRGLKEVHMHGRHMSTPAEASSFPHHLVGLDFHHRFANRDLSRPIHSRPSSLDVGYSRDGFAATRRHECSVVYSQKGRRLGVRGVSWKETDIPGHPGCDGGRWSRVHNRYARLSDVTCNYHTHIW